MGRKGQALRKHGQFLDVIIDEYTMILFKDDQFRIIFCLEKTIVKRTKYIKSVMLHKGQNKNLRNSEIVTLE